MKTITRTQALQAVVDGGEVYAVPEGGIFHLFDDVDDALECAKRVGAEVLDWETGQRADI